jgi:hypothetical protein
MGNINWELTADETKFLSACLKAHNAMESIGVAGAEAGRKTKSLFDEGIKGIGKFAESVIGVGSAMGAVMSVVDQLKREHEHLLAIQKRAADQAQSTGEARAGALLAMPGARAEDAGKMIASIAKSTNASSRDLWQVAGQTWGSRGNMSDRDYEDALRTVARVGTIAPGVDMPALGKGLLTGMGVTGAHPNEMMGWFRSVGGRSKMGIEDAAAVLGPALQTGRLLGTDSKTIGALTAFLSQSGVPMAGRAAPTVTIMEELAKATTAGNGIIPSEGMFGGHPTFAPLKSQGLSGQLAEMQNAWQTLNPEGRELLAAKLPGNAQAKAALRGLVSRDPRSTGIWDTAMKNIRNPAAPENAADLEALFDDIAGGPTEPSRTLTRTGSSLAGQLRGTQTKEALAGAARSVTSQMLETIPTARPWRQMAGYDIGTFFGADPAETAISTLEQTKREVRQANMTPGEFLSGLPGGAGMKRDPTIDKLDELIRAIKEASDGTQKVELKGQIPPPGSHVERN